MSITKQAVATAILALIAYAPVSAQGILPDPDRVDPVATEDGDEDGTGDRGRFRDDDGDGHDDGCPEPQLEMRIENNEIYVGNGRTGDRVALLIGIEEASYELPGGAQLRLEPIFVLALGTFDEAGEYRWRLEGDLSESEPLSVRVQAVSADEHGCFSASGMWQLDYRGASGQFDGRRLSQLELESRGYGRSAAAAGRHGLA